MAAELDGPRIEPRDGAARQLVVFLHGYGADGNDLIEIGRAWQQLLPQAAFVSPHAPQPCGQGGGARRSPACSAIMVPWLKPTSAIAEEVSLRRASSASRN